MSSKPPILVSAGRAALSLGLSLRQFVEAAATLGVVAVERRDGIPWFREMDVDRIRVQLGSKHPHQCRITGDIQHRDG